MGAAQSNVQDYEKCHRCKNWEVAYINDEGTQKLLARRGSGYFKESLEVSGVFCAQEERVRLGGRGVRCEFECESADNAAARGLTASVARGLPPRQVP